MKIDLLEDEDAISFNHYRSAGSDSWSSYSKKSFRKAITKRDELVEYAKEINSKVFL